MNRFLFLAIFLSYHLSIFSQCQPMTDRDLQSAKHRLNAQFRQGNNFQLASDYARIYCMTSNQAKEIATYLSSDRDKIDFLKASFPTIIDKENFTDVMDVFRTISSAMRLYHHTLGAGQYPQNPRQPISQNHNCRQAMDPATFNQLKSQISILSNDRTIASAVLQSAQTTCMTTQQISTVVNYLHDENIKLDVLKRLMPQCFDIENYDQLANLLSTGSRQIFQNYIQNPRGNYNQSQNLNCNPMADSELPEFIKSVNNQSFDKDKVEHIKTHLAQRCLNTKQIKQVVNLIGFDASRLDIAKFLYTNCSDKEKYFVVVETLNFSSSKTELNEYIKSK